MAKLVWMAMAVFVACGGGNNDPTPPCPGSSCADATADSSSGPVIVPGFRILAQPKLGAGTIRNRVIALGTEADGSPTLDQIRLYVDRDTAGSFARSTLVLGPLGATTEFVPCDVASPGCLGPATFTLVRTADLAMPLASLTVDIVDPIEVNPARACLGGGSVLHLSGNDQIFNGEATIADATWAFEQVYDNYLVATVTPPASTSSWRLVFDTRVYAPYMVPETYEEATKSDPFQSNLVIDHPALDVSGFGSACTAVEGRFDVLAYERDIDGVVIATIAFEQRCEGSTTTRLTGCIHYQR